MKNYEILNANRVLSEFLDEPLKGLFKFKLFGIKTELESRIKIIEQTLDGIEDEEEIEDILNIDQEIAIDKFYKEELSELEMSVRQVGMLRPLIHDSDYKEE